MQKTTWRTQRLVWPAKSGGRTEIMVAVNSINTDVRITEWWVPAEAGDDFRPAESRMVDMSVQNARDMIAFLQELLPQLAEATR